MRDFQKELQRIIDGASNPEEIKPLEKLYNIHKRSLPVGIDKIVIYNTTKKQAVKLLDGVLKAKCYQHDDKDSKTVIYYDVIPVNAKPKERSIYFNERPIVIE